MLRVTMMVLIAFMAQAHGREKATTHLANAWDFTNKVVDKLADKLGDRVRQVWSLHHIRLDGTMLGKPSLDVGLKVSRPLALTKFAPSINFPGVDQSLSRSSQCQALFQSALIRSQTCLNLAPSVGRGRQSFAIPSASRLPGLRTFPTALNLAASASSASGEAPAWNFSVTDIRVGKIVKAWEHPNSTKLFCEMIDVGEEQPRQIVSGLRAHYKQEEMEGAQCLVVCNLKKAKLAGMESNGMVLCSSNAEGKVEFVNPPADAPIGERVMCEGMGGNPETPNRVNKKKIWQAISPDLKMVDGIAKFKDVPIMTSTGPCKSLTIVEGQLS